MKPTLPLVLVVLNAHTTFRDIISSLAIFVWLMGTQGAQAHYVWVRASKVIWSEYTRIISVLSDAK